ncbi:hypothetical protein [Nocardiopsis alba]|uniref:Putative membrane protein n=1 Tax=Nocardiopsis alba (strain ATCC BAA-2165 / BE74) TaxID=1205910 RepID=J7LBG8_NOCAA|nr:hypothetical protein [Nocardiopsis alba]AFR08740.1 putative membrane protein [Nocardiopsis alba ATCC BAA-2165]
MSERKQSPRHLTLSILRVLFVATFAAFFLVAILMVLGQLVGTVLSLPGLVSAASDHLLVPAVTLASTFGVIAFLASYLQKDDQETPAA